MAMKVLTKKKINQTIGYYIVAILLVVGIGGYYGYNGLVEYQNSSANLQEGQSALNDLRVKSDLASSNYRNLRNDLELQNSAVNQAIEKILPTSESFTALARELDNYFLRNTTLANPIFLSDLRFNTPIIQEENNYAELPFSMSLNGTENALMNFLKYVENSGDLTNRTRLLSIDNLSISFGDIASEGPTIGNRNVNVSLQMRAFFQKPISEISESETAAQ
jgi:Tfp pilus assembly protein PilO